MRDGARPRLAGAAPAAHAPAAHVSAPPRSTPARRPVRQDAAMGEMRERMLRGEPYVAGDTVVGAGAVVAKDLPAGVVAGGVPARVLREIDERDRVEAPER